MRKRRAVRQRHAHVRPLHVATAERAGSCGAVHHAVHTRDNVRDLTATQ
jgi:hypothetical protein